MSDSLRSAIDALAAHADRRALAASSAALSSVYRADPGRPRTAGAMEGDAARLAYLATRFPATVAALARVGAEVAARVDLSSVDEVLELGAGPGATPWALADLVSPTARFTLVDEDHRMLAIAGALAERRWPGEARRVTTTLARLSAPEAVGAADLVVVSYALGEIAPGARSDLVSRAWAAARRALVVVEPGTTEGFARVLDARGLGLRLGGHLLAPCPHEAACPVAGPDWCHFSVRLERSRLHRQLKGGTLGYEDEKFSYVVLAREAGPRASARLVRRPTVHPRHVVLSTCGPEGLDEVTITKREGPRYRTARHARWGDGWE